MTRLQHRPETKKPDSLAELSLWCPAVTAKHGAMKTELFHMDNFFHAASRNVSRTQSIHATPALISSRAFISLTL